MLTANRAPEALPAASVLVVRDAPFEVLMLQRHERRSFAPSAWVFPGGIAEPSDHEIARAQADGSVLAAMRVTGVRETFEESGVWLGTPLEGIEESRRRLLAGTLPFRTILESSAVEWERLVPASRWITPEGLPKRFDTWFFVAAVPRSVVATAEDSESVDVAWLAPSEALRRNAAGTMPMVFPTLRNLEAIAGFGCAADLVAARRGAVIEPIQPVLVGGKPTLP